MIKSKYNIHSLIALWGLLYTTVGLFLLDILALLQLAGLVHSVLAISQVYGVISFYTPLLLLSIVALKQNATIITVNSPQSQITFSNYFLRFSSKYNLTDFDSYCSRAVYSRLGEFQILYLIKGQKIVKKISGKFYKNMPEIKAGLLNLPYIGEKQFSDLDKLKIFFHRYVLD